MSTQNSLVLLGRVLSLKDGLPLILVCDSLLQTGRFLVEETARKAACNVIYISFETLNKPEYADEMIDASGLGIKHIAESVKKVVPKAEPGPAAKKTLIVVDSLNYIEPEETTQFVTSLIQPNTVVIAVYHSDLYVKAKAISAFPASQRLLTYIASSIFDVEPLNVNIYDEDLHNEVHALRVPISSDINSRKFKATLTNRRKSGRSLTYKFVINTETHEYEVFKAASSEGLNQEDESLLKDLTTFNLTTNLKQKLAKEQVELPFLQAQEELGSYSGAIVYEFEKDDDYDEEDPYEDPF